MDDTNLQSQIRMLVACTGSVASIKLEDIINKLQMACSKIAVEVIVTANSLHFINLSRIKVPVHQDADEWTNWSKIGDPVLHIELRKSADLLLIAPLDANTMAKISHGICDNLLTSLVRAWDVKKPLLFAPAMNTLMYEHPLTAQQITTLESFGYQCIPTVSKTLACGDTGDGAMAEVDTIVAAVLSALSACIST